ncbi:MAG TPA: hypothetical protein VJ302_30725 [Blastocatellia bacterium]|nr:hypothetical protein [Blastocatellia bacterium]
MDAVKTAPAAENAGKPYRFDESEFDITFNARPGAEKPTLVTHRIRKAADEELVEWENASAFQSIEVSKREDEIRIDEEAMNARLWRKIIDKVKGYRFGDGLPVDEFRTLTDEQKDQMRTSHKVGAIRALYWSSCEVDYQEVPGEDEGISFSGEIWRIKQTIRGGVFTVIHSLREPTEPERLKFRRSASSTTYLRGSRKQQSTTRTNLRAYIELYNYLTVNIEGGEVGGLTFAESNQASFLKAIDPIFKRQVVNCLMGAIDTELQD